MILFFFFHLLFFSFLITLVFQGLLRLLRRFICLGWGGWLNRTTLCLLKLIFDSHFLIPFEAVQHLQLFNPLLKLLLLIPCLQLVVCLELFEGKFVDFILETLHLVLGRPLPAVEPYLSSD